MAMRGKFERAQAQNALNDPLRNHIVDRPNWAWVRSNGGYAQYWAGKDANGRGRIAIVRGDISTGLYDAEKIDLPYNAGIKYNVADVTEIVQMVEDYF